MAIVERIMRQACSNCQHGRQTQSHVQRPAGYGLMAPRPPVFNARHEGGKRAINSGTLLNLRVESL
jgi:hypothetical protein